MSETTKLPFDPIPVSGIATADPKPAFSRSVTDAGGLLPPVRKPVSALPSGIAPEAPPEPNPMPGTPPPNPAAVGGFLRDLFKPTRGKGAVAAGLVSLFAGAYGLNLVMPIQTPPSKPRVPESETAKGPQPKIDVERTSPQMAEERNSLLPEPGKLPPLPAPGEFGSGRSEGLPPPNDPRNRASGDERWGSAGSSRTEQPGGGALPALPALPAGGFGGGGSEPPAKPALPALPPPGDSGFRPAGGTLPPLNEPKDNTVPPPGGGMGGLPPLPKPGEPPSIDNRKSELPPLPEPGKLGAGGGLPPPATAFAPAADGKLPPPLPNPDDKLPKPLIDAKPDAGKLPDLPVPGSTPAGTLPPISAAPVGMKKDEPPLPPPGGMGSFAPTVRSSTPPPDAVPEQPPKTDFDVDIVRVRGSDTYATISDKFYGSTRYAAALRAFNRGADLGQLREVQVPPLHVIRTQAGGREREAEAPAEPRGVVPAGGIRGPVLDAPVQPPDTAPEAVDWGAPGKRRSSVRYERYTTPKDGMTAREVAKAVYDDEQAWGRLSGPRGAKLRADDPLPRGTEVTVPREELPWK